MWQAKAREAREQRRAQLTAAHNFIISLVADCLDLDQTTVEEFVIDNFRVTVFLFSLFDVGSSDNNEKLITVSILRHS